MHVAVWNNYSRHYCMVIRNGGLIMRVFISGIIILSMAGCFRDTERDEHLARMFANIVITAEAQQHAEAPPVQQTAAAIKTAAEAGLKVLDYEMDR